MIKKTLGTAAAVLTLGTGCVVTYTEPVVRLTSYPVEQQVVVTQPVVTVDEWVVYEPIWPIGYYDVFFYGGRRCYRLRQEYRHHEVARRDQRNDNRNDKRNDNRNDKRNDNRNDKRNQDGR